MSKRVIAILLGILMILSAVPVALPVGLVTAESSTTSTKAPTPIVLPIKETNKTSEKVSKPINIPPTQKIDPELLELVKELSNTREQVKLPIKIFASGEVRKLDVQGVKIIGRANIAGKYIYLAELQITPDALKRLRKLASIKGVEYITTLSSVKPLLENMPKEKLDQEKILENLKGRKDLMLNRIFTVPKRIGNYRLASPRSLIRRFPLRTNDAMQYLLKTMKERAPIPQDIYAVTHMGSTTAWNKYNITGSGVNVAIIDSGIDFGNPDLQDAYAVDTNPESPYYGWPIAFDSASMMAYMLYDYAFPEILTFWGWILIYPWYTNTSLITGIPVILQEPAVIGYCGSNFSTAFSGMELANIQDPLERSKVINNTLTFLSNGSFEGTILLVDDDNGENNGGDFFDFDPYYIEALDILGYNYTIYRVPAYESGPNTTVLSQYDAVIWFTGEYWNNTLTNEDIANLEEYLDNGGKLFLISTDFLDDKGFVQSVETEVIYNQTNVIAPEKYKYNYHYFNLTEPVSKLIVTTTSQYGTGDSSTEFDIDIYLYYKVGDEWERIGSSWNWGPNETITVENPELGEYMVKVKSYRNEGYPEYTYNITITIEKEGELVPSEFAGEYLHVNASTYYYQDLGVASVGEMNGERFRIGTVNKGVANVIYYTYGNMKLPLLRPAYSDIFADFVVPDENASVLVTTYMALPYDIERDTLWPIRLPINENLTLPYSGYVKIGLHPDLALALINTPPDDQYLEPGWVLVVDSDGDSKYDKAYVDLTSEWGYFVDFNEDVGHTKENPVVAWDVVKADGTIGQDGYDDISGGLIYYIADGETPIPYSQVIYNRWNLEEYEVPENKTVPGNGDLVAFMIGTIYAGGLEHGTLCAAAVGARGRTIGPEELTDDESQMYPTYGNAKGAKIIAEGDLYTLLAVWEDMMLFATEGYDGIPNTGDEARITSNSYGYSLTYAIDRGFNWEDRFLIWLSEMYAPYTAHFFAAGNEGPGYSTDSSNGASPGVITVGAATEFGYRKAVGWDYEAEYGDVADFSSRGPNALGRVKPDVLATGMFGLGSAPLNMQYWRMHPIINGRYANEIWAGTSLATPMAAGVGALVEEAFYRTHGRYPTAEELKEILKSAAEDTDNDVFLQGAGYLNATRAVEIALEVNGVKVSPTEWQAGSYMGHDYKAFPSVIYPGESDTQEFTLTNYGDARDVEISAEVFEKTGDVEIPIMGITNEPQMIPVTYAIPEDAELMKVSFYTDVGGPYSYILVRLYGYKDGQLKLINEGSGYRTNVVSFTVRNPRARAEQLFLQVRDIMSGTPYDGKVKLEFYKRVPWSWVTLDKETLHLPAKGEGTFTATITVPEDTPLGIYEGAIYVKYDSHVTTIPVSVVVASPKPEFEFGGNTEASGLYDNSNVYGGSTDGGDWRLFYFNVPPEEAKDSYIIADVSWNDNMAAITPYMLQPSSDEWSVYYEGIFGPHTLSHTATGKPIASNESILVAKAVPGLHAMWLHNTEINASHATFYGKVGVAKVTPSKVTMIAESKEGEGQIRVRIPDFVGNLTAYGVGFERLIRKTGVTAPATGESWYYTVTVVNATRLRVETSSTWNNLDIDLYVYYYDESMGDWKEIGSSETPTANEKVEITMPKDGVYLIEVYGYSNPKPGKATFDLEIGITLGKIKDIFKEQNVEAPEAGNYTIHYFEVTEHADALVVKTESEDDDNYGLDIDLQVYHYDEATGKWEHLGGSYSWTADEEVVVPKPPMGLYAAVVRSYSNPAPGETHYNITASLVVSGRELFVKNVTKVNGEYVVTYGYNLTSLPNTTIYKGSIKIGGTRTGELFDVPIEIAPNPYVTDFGIVNVTIKPVPPEVGQFFTINVNIKNYGLNNASAPVKLIRDRLTEVGSERKEIAAGDVEPVSFNVTLSDLDMHEFTVVLDYPYDFIKDNDVKVIKVRAMQPVEGTELMWSIGDAEIVNVTSERSEMIATFATPEDSALVGVFAKLPENWTFYSVVGENATVISRELLEDNATLEIVLAIRNSSKLHIYYGTYEEAPRVTEELKEKGIKVPVFIQETTNGTAEIKEAKKTTVDGKPAISITVDGEHNATVKLAVILPKDIKKYNVTIRDADLLAEELIRYKTYALLTLEIKLHSPAEIVITYTLPSSYGGSYASMLVMLNYMYYHNFIKYNATYSELYKKVLGAGVDNETLQKAEKLHEMAMEEYKKAVSISGGVALNSSDPRVFIHLRKAYIYIREAVKLLVKIVPEE